MTVRGTSVPGCGPTASVVATPHQGPAPPWAPRSHGITEHLKLWFEVPPTSKPSSSVLAAQSCVTQRDPMDQASLSVDFSRPEYWSGLPFPPPGDLPYPGIEPGSPGPC